MVATTPSPRAKKIESTIALVLAILAAVAAWYAPKGMNWLLIVVLFVAVFVLLGLASTGRVLGVLINEQKMMSLSRFQMAVWTLLIVSAYLAIAMERVKGPDVVDPLIIGIDWQVWALLGISTTSLVGTPLLNQNKKAKTPTNSVDPAAPSAVQKAADSVGVTPQVVEANRSGVLYGNASVADASVADMFEGEELANANLIDLSKLQMFFFTVIVASVYAVQLYQLIAHNTLTDDVSLPTVNEGLLALLGVSHVGYLGSKGITQTPSN